MSSASPPRDAGLDAALSASFGEAVRAAGETVLDYRIAGAPVRLCVAGAELARSLPQAFTHLLDDKAGDNGLTVHVWDSRSTGAPAPPRPSAPLRRSSFGPVYHYRAGSLQGTFRPNACVSAAFDSARSVAWFHVDDGNGLDAWEYAAPLRQILDWWLGERGVSFVHAGALGTPDGGVLLAGPSGSGKSTSCLACLGSSFLGFAGDDYTAAEVGEEGAYVHSLYSSAKLDASHAARLPRLRVLLQDDSLRMIEEKVVLQLSPAFATQLTAGFPLRAVVIPRVAADGPRLRRITPAAALTAIAPSTLLQSRPPRPEALAELATLVRRLPCYELELGPRIDEIPRAIERLLENS